LVTLFVGPTLFHMKPKEITRYVIDFPINLSRSLFGIPGELNGPEANSTNRTRYTRHSQVTVTLFWVGEKAGKDNHDISNASSAWDEEWAAHFGGVDAPNTRGANFFPEDFTPFENPFYFALPYNDFDKKGKRKRESWELVPWSGGKKWSEKESMLKNRWIKVIKDGRSAYAQWEDVGPFGEEDSDYVFGTVRPKSKSNKNAGLDVSPAVNQYLDLNDIDTVDWQFIDEEDVPNGPWKMVITRS
ncbi:MAG: hypothetical protein ABI747_03360, partial [Candidatus Moraniibacteriota bacterium]